MFGQYRKRVPQCERNASYLHAPPFPPPPGRGGEEPPHANAIFIWKPTDTISILFPRAMGTADLDSVGF